MTTGNMSSSDAAQWLSKIQQVQSAKSTPEQRARVKERAEHISKIAEHSKKAARSEWIALVCKSAVVLLMASLFLQASKMFGSKSEHLVRLVRWS
jgi:hypothetical protein